jgi:predicted RNA-binding protein YlxR (DUF448 family)
MEANDRLNPSARAKPAPAESERRCILTGAPAARAGLIRLAIGPDGQVAPDLGEKLPGRGAWMRPDAQLLADLAGRGRLAGAIARALKRPVTVPDDLASRIITGLEQRLADRLGLANRAGHLVPGHDRIAEALVRGRVALLLHAADARPDGMAKLDGKARALDVPRAQLPFGRDRLSAAMGRDNVVHLAVVDAGCAARITADLERWQAFAGQTAQLDDEPAATGVAVGGHEGQEAPK